MKSYEKEFCKELVNDIGVDESVIEEVWQYIMSNNFSDSSSKLGFIKTHINHSNIEHIDRLIYAIDGDIVELLEFFDADYDNLYSMENTKDKWKDSDFAGEIEDRIEELQEEAAEDEDEDW